jgi:glycosyl transferase, family 25
MTANLAVFVINLDNSTDRLAHAKDRLDVAGLHFTRIPAFDGRGKDVSAIPEYDRKATLAWFGRELMGGEIGCYLSHLRAIDAFLATTSDYGVVFEDDIDLPDGASDILSEVVKQSARLGGGFAVCNLGMPANMARSRLGDVQTVSGRFELFRAHYPPMSTHALLWSQSGAEAFRRECSQVRAPIDDWIRHWGTCGPKVLALRPAPIPVVDADSDIDQGSVVLRGQPWQENDPKAHSRYQRMKFIDKIRAYLALAETRLRRR